VLPGKRLSLQRHARRSEHWVVVAGAGRVECDGSTDDVEAGESTFIPMSAVHRLANPGTETLSIIEVQVGEYVGEDDIERLEEDWSRQEE
jgi:mannose-6-phosphate isomerase-like protein (cupin superfamily)